MRARAGIAVLSALGALLVTSAAGARINTALPAAGPVLSGDALVWATKRGHGGFDVRVATDQSDARVLQRFSPRPNYSWALPRLSASPDRIAVAVHHLIGGPGNTSGIRDVHSGPPGGPLEPLGGTCSVHGPQSPRPVDVRANAVLYEPCDGVPGLEVRDFGPPASTQRIPEGRGRGFRLAGRWAAWLETDLGWWNDATLADIVVYDRVGMNVAYRIPRESFGSQTGDGVHSVDLQEDGTVAFSYVTREGRFVGWASPEEPRVHRVLSSRRKWYEVRIRGDQIAFLRGRSFNWDIPLGEIGVSDLSGNTRIVARGVQDRVGGPDGFDFDGDRVAWSSLGCSDARLHVRRIDAAPLPFRQRTGCELRLRRRPAVRRRTVRLLFDCSGFADDYCDVRRLRLTRRGVVLAAGSRQNPIPRGDGAADVRTKLTRAGRRLLRPGARLRTTAVATVTDDMGRRERRRATVVLTRPG